jgi:peptidoglycan/xylan/chitin deacetylase (PgdA/CDA1 family)
VPKPMLVFGVTYHGSTSKAFQELDNVYAKHISARQLEFHLQWFTKHFKIMTIGEIWNRYSEGTLPPNSMFLSFHDGYGGNFETALPILQSFGVRANFFIPTAFVGTERRFWVDILDAAFKYTRVKEIRIASDQGEDVFTLDTQADRLKAVFVMRKSLKLFPETARPQQMNLILNQLGWSSSEDVPRLGPHERNMNWGQIQELADSGMEIGSHTHQHIILACQDEATIRYEMKTSKELIESNLEKPCNLFCYPNGKYPGSGNDLTDRIAAELGYKHTVYMMSQYNLIHPKIFRLTGAALGEDTESHELKRIFSKSKYRMLRMRGGKIWRWKTDALESQQPHLRQ